MSNYKLQNFFVALLSVVVLGVLALWVVPAAAQTPPPDLGLGADTAGAIGLPATDIRLVIARIIRTVLGIIGIVAVVLIIYAGVTWMTAGGNEEKIATAKKILLNSVIGLGIVLSSYAIASFVINRLTAATSNLPEHCFDTTRNADETGVDCGGSCGACQAGGGGSNFSVGGSGLFYVAHLPPAGSLCVRNASISVVFSRDVDAASLKGRAVVKKKSGGAPINGIWKHGSRKNTAIFVPEGSCGPLPGNDCLEADTAYRLEINEPNGIKALNSNVSLNCSLKSGCGPIEFTSGSGVDREPPKLNFVSPPAESAFQGGQMVPVKISFSDDNGLQNITLYQGDSLVQSQGFTTCQKSGTIDMAWPTVGLQPGPYQLQTVGLDWSAAESVAGIQLHIRPAHCFNNTLERDLGEEQAGPPACGGVCGACAGAACSGPNQCAGGFCDIQAGKNAGVCVEKMKINTVTPASGAPGTFVGLTGVYFGSRPGKVYFAKTANPRSDTLSDWVTAEPPSCGAGFNFWNTNYILVAVPVGAVNGPIMVIAQGTGSVPVVDTTNDSWGPKLPDFKITNERRPGLCQVVPASASPGSPVQLIGTGFGLFDNALDRVIFGQSKASVFPADWTDAAIKATVPFEAEGETALFISNNGIESNAVPFYIKKGAAENVPLISSVSPNRAARGQYLTVEGKNFGSQLGAVWFKATPESEAILGDFSFPAACQGALWREEQIIVKFPLNKGDPGKRYFVQIKTADGKVSPLNSDVYVVVENGLPAPGICNITPASGPLPLPGGKVLTIVGEYFGVNPDVFFWKTGSDPKNLTGRVAADKKAPYAASETIINVLPPTTTETGPVVVARGADNKVSNAVNFAVYDCVKNNQTCPLNNYTCCASGSDVGICKPSTELCQGAFRSTGYTWRFSTRDIPEVPRVVERCDDLTSQGRNIPTPAPSIIWDQGASGDHHSVCRTALSTVEFTLPLNQATVNAGTVAMNKCDRVDGTTCVNPQPVKLNPQSFRLKTAAGQPNAVVRQYMELSPEIGRFDDNSWYQVVLTTGIKSAGSSTSSLAIAVDRPCQTPNSAYCYAFKTGAEDCRLKTVVVTPYSYFTSVLEAPIRYRLNGDAEFELRYFGNGLSTQRCVMMSMAGYSWSWETSRKEYADIYGPTNAQSAQASALANTVAVGLNDPDDAVHIKATAATSSLALSGVSPLTIDLSNPEIVDYWPKCLEACTNAEVGVEFNVSMSNRNLPGAISRGTVQLLKCNDENCLSTVSVLALNDVALDPNSRYTILKLANSQENSKELEPNSLYQVIVSASSTAPNALNQLWSAAKLNDPSVASKPYNKSFTWRFRTKKDRCVIDRAEVLPAVFYAANIKQKKVYNVNSFSSPDACSAAGQKLNPWLSNWQWSSSDLQVARVDTFSTKGKNSFCTPQCLRKGSDIPASANAFLPVCGNGVVEAGEDCDAPNKNNGCNLKCLFNGNTDTTTCGNGKVEKQLGEACDPKDPLTQIGCGANCLHQGSAVKTNETEVTASICGNGLIGSGEDCDLGIEANTASSSSRLGCSEKCLHLGTRLSTKWCFDNTLTYVAGGFTEAEFKAACALSYSQCGDGVFNPDEDPGCDTKDGWNSRECTSHCLRKTDTECLPGTEGCDANGRHSGSSVFYSTPSSCGDGATGIGEDSFCETQLNGRHDGLVDPWSLVTGVGLGVPTGEPPSQSSLIKAETRQGTKSDTVAGAGRFVVACGFTTDQECRQSFGPDYGVGANTCCYLRSRLISTYPANNAGAVCANTYLEAVFDGHIDASTLPGNFLIAQGSTKGCGADTDVTSIVFGSHDSVVKPWYRKAFDRIAATFRGWFSPTASAVTATSWCVRGDTGKAEVILSSPGVVPVSKIVVRLSKALAFNTDYAIILKEGVKDLKGVSIGGTAPGKNINWKFTTTSRICDVKSVTVEPGQWYFSRANATTTLQAKAATGANVFIQPIPGVYDWEFAWGPTNPYVAVQPTTSSLAQVSAQNRNGEVDVRATAVITANANNAQNLGPAATGKSHMIVFLCENPWPPKDLLVNGKGPFVIFPYEDKANNNDGFSLSSNSFNNTAIPPSAAVSDGYFNFSLYYCADSGVFGAADDLPYLRPAVQVADTIVSRENALKRFFFTNSNNADVIGIQVFANPAHLTAEEWYSADQSRGGKGFTGNLSTINVDGYSGVTDGNNIYLDVLNYSSATKSVHTNIYLLSMNAGAQAITRQVFEQLVKNLKFNVNLTNYGYCGLTTENPGFTTSCDSDLDCRTPEICSNSISKLKRNYQRLRDLKNIKVSLEEYAANNSRRYPELKEGTYLTGQTISVWPSWSVLGNAIGKNLPVDPLNELAPAGTCSASTNRFCNTDTACPQGEKCILHDPLTGWSVADRRFSFACAKESYGYRYFSSPQNGYLIKSNFEKPGIEIANNTAFTADFVDSMRFTINDTNGICNQDQEISTINQGRCGDGQLNLNKGEQCDPPGKTRYGACGQDKADHIRVEVCTDTCQWKKADTEFIKCSTLSKCGNNVVEIGEQCDDGAQNGAYNRCSLKCTWPPEKENPGYCGDAFVTAKQEICDIRFGLGGKKGWCSGQLAGKPCDTAAECNTTDGEAVSFAGLCHFADSTIGRYAPAQMNSCSFDCQARGSFCGDGIVQAEFGEECDGNEECVLEGKRALRQCTSDCRRADASAVAWWKLDDAKVDDARHTFFNAINSYHATCIKADGECPAFVRDGAVKSSFIFGEGDFLTVPHYSVFDLKEVAIAAWVRIPDATPEGVYRILGKQKSKNAGEAEQDYTFSVGVDNGPKKLLFTSVGIFGKAEVKLPATFKVNEWHHFAVTAGTFDGKREIVFYADGSALPSAAMTMSDTGDIAKEAKNDFPVFIGERGMIDEVKVYGRILAPAEVKNDADRGWFCPAQLSGRVAAAPPGSCGDGTVGAGEACDKGVQNGVVCAPRYGRSCSYCSNDCKNIIEVQPKEFCGNGIIEGEERCDVDPSSSLIYAKESSEQTAKEIAEGKNGYLVYQCSGEPQQTYTLQKGTKSCINSCFILKPECIRCGKDPNGVNVAGGIMNVLTPTSTTNPLMAKPGSNGTLDLYISSSIDTARKVGHAHWQETSEAAYFLRPPDENPTTSANRARINSHPICSSGPEPNYTLRINNDATHKINFPVFTNPNPWQYDLVLSPVINQNIRPNDVRIVVSWVTPVDFYGGFFIPKIGDGQTTLERNSFKDENNEKATGLNYYTQQSKSGIWAHGFGNPPGRKITAEAFTANTESGEGLYFLTNQMRTDAYLFYVRTPDSNGIKRHKSTARLKVEVYLPEDDTNDQHFALPSYTFLLSNAQNSDNERARYWHVFTLKRAKNEAVAERIVPVNKIITDIKRH